MREAHGCRSCFPVLCALCVPMAPAVFLLHGVLRRCFSLCLLHLISIQSLLRLRCVIHCCSSIRSARSPTAARRFSFDVWCELRIALRVFSWCCWIWLLGSSFSCGLGCCALVSAWLLVALDSRWWCCVVARHPPPCCCSVTAAQFFVRCIPVRVSPPRSAAFLLLSSLFSFRSANSRAVGVALAGKTVQLQLRNGKKSALARPSKSVSTVTLANDFRSKSSRSARTIRALTAGSFLRGDLAAFAITRYHKLRKATVGVAAKKTARRRSRKTVA